MISEASPSAPPERVESAPLVSAIIAVYNQVDLLDRCLASLARQTVDSLEVIAVSDASPEDPGPVVRRHPGVRLLVHPTNAGYASANNTGLKAACGRYLLFLNSDTELPPDTIQRLLEYLEQEPEAGAVTPTLRLPDGTVQRSCYGFPDLRFAWLWDSAAHLRRPDHPRLREYNYADWDHASDRWVEHVMTSCFLIRREVYERIGGMDPTLPLFYNDVDYCQRMVGAGFPIRYLSGVEILHHGNASVGSGTRTLVRVYADRYRYLGKWFGWRGCLGMWYSLVSRVGYETLSGLARGRADEAGEALVRGFRLARGMVAGR